MGDIYKFACLNVAALSTESDYDGFIYESRDTRDEFGLRAPLASFLGRSYEEKISNGKECILLRGTSKLLWDFQSDLPRSSASNAPLFKRAWVYQERCLARRTLAIATNSLYWACDESSQGEQPESADMRRPRFHDAQVTAHRRILALFALTHPPRRWD